MQTFTSRLDRIITIEATRQIVFSFFTDNALWASWWGKGSSIEARRGGRVTIRYPNGSLAIGEVLDIDAPTRIVFTYGMEQGSPIPPNGSRVTIQLDEHEDGTRLHLSHEFNDQAARDHYVQGWRYQLSLFANVVADVVHVGAMTAMDGWFAAWNERDAAARQQKFEPLVADSIRFRDRFSLTTGLEDLVEQVGAFHAFMPGVQIERHGEPRRCQGHALADWVALTADGSTKASGTNVFVFAPNGRISSVTRFWTDAARTP